MNQRITEKQRNVYEAVRRAYAEAGRPPTLAQIAKWAGLRSQSGVSKAVAKLVDAGFLVYLGAGHGAGGGTVLPREDAIQRDPENVQAMLDAYRGALAAALEPGSVRASPVNGKCGRCGNAVADGEALAIAEDWSALRLVIVCSACGRKLDG